MINIFRYYSINIEIIGNAQENNFKVSLSSSSWARQYLLGGTCQILYTDVKTNGQQAWQYKEQGK